MSKPTVRAIYWLSKGYTKATVILASKETGQRAATLTCTPFKGLSRAEKYRECCRFIQKHEGSALVPPPYKPTYERIKHHPTSTA